MKLLAVKAV